MSGPVLRQLAATWGKWYELIEEKRAAEQQAEMDSMTDQRNAMILKKFMHRDMAKAWATWMELHDMFALIRRAAGRMMNRVIAGSFERWVEYVDEIIETRTKIQR